MAEEAKEAEAKEAAVRIRAVLPNLKIAMNTAKLQLPGGTVGLAIVVKAPDGTGRVTATFEAEGFLRDLETLVADEVARRNRPTSSTEHRPGKEVLVGVAVLLHDREGRVLVGRRKGRRYPDTWSFPGGLMEFGEDPTRSALRELHEETGLSPRTVRPFAVCPYVNNSFDELEEQFITLYFQAEDFDGAPQIMEPDKCAEWRWVDLSAIPEPHFPPVAHMLTELRRSHDG